MITCRELIELLCDFIDDELAPEQRQQVEQHLGDCPPCVIYVETYRLTITLSRKLPCAPLPERTAERLRKLIAQAGANPCDAPRPGEQGKPPPGWQRPIPPSGGISPPLG